MKTGKGRGVKGRRGQTRKRKKEAREKSQNRALGQKSNMLVVKKVKPLFRRKITFSVNSLHLGHFYIKSHCCHLKRTHRHVFTRAKTHHEFLRPHAHFKQWMRFQQKLCFGLSAVFLSVLKKE